MKWKGSAGIAKPKPAEHAPGETAERILDTAERLFAERGLEATSIRDITVAAEVNLGAINYHFGTKQKLIESVILRHFGPVNQRRLELLDEVERKSGNKTPTIERLLEALIRPTVEASFAFGKRKTSFMRFMARCHSEPNPEIERLMRAQLQPMMTRFAGTFARALPSLSREELFWRLMFTFGALLHALLISSSENTLPDGLREKINADRLIQRLVAFATAGLKAPPPQKQQVS